MMSDFSGIPPYPDTGVPEELDICRFVANQLRANPLLFGRDVQTIRAHLENNAECFGGPELAKCGDRAAALRREGNALYVEKQFWKAIEKYNESICAAPNGSADLGIGYANRSAVFCEMKHYGLALANIELAKKHHYPEHLMPKLAAREVTCRQGLKETDHSTDLSESEQMAEMFAFKLEPNPRIPFLAKGITMRSVPIYGRSMVAERRFEAGDIILNEKSVIGSVLWDKRFVRCSACRTDNWAHLIPCPNCASVMYCDEECLKEGLKWHRFECGASTNMSKFCGSWMGAKMFFYGLSLFENDVEKMMKFCRANQGKGGCFFDLDYSNYSPLEEFKVFLKTSFKRFSCSIADKTLDKFFAAMLFENYMKVPLVQSLITGEAQKTFMLACFYSFIKITGNLFIQHQYQNCYLYPIASGFRHSCDPNAYLLERGNQMRVIVLRPIRRGEQILVSYGPLCDQQDVKYDDARINALKKNCLCDYCSGGTQMQWWIRFRLPCAIDPDQLAAAHRALEDGYPTRVEGLKVLQQVIQRYGSNHPQKDYLELVCQYRDALVSALHWSSSFAARQKIVGKIA